MTEIATWLTGTHRAVGRRQIAAGDARTACLRRRYDAPIEDVWEACTVPERLGRWFLPVSGDLRPGGTFHLAGNASGEILRCEPPRLLRVTWAYGERSANEVELRLSPGGDGDTVLEIEHASVDRLVEVDGRRVDPFLNDAESGLWGVGVGWEMPLTYGLTALLRGELPAAPGPEPFGITPEMREIADRINQEWVAAVKAG
jgi:uncharacterized protein YndB with AHSA1/START domain